jgi:hypothetical protein
VDTEPPAGRKSGHQQADRSSAITCSERRSR